MVFDIDGTVLDTMSIHWIAWKRAVSEVGLTMTFSQFVSWAGRPLRGIFEQLAQDQGKTIDVEHAMELKDRYFVEESAHLTTVAPVMRIFHEGRRRGLRIGAATGGGRAQIEEALQRVGLFGEGAEETFDAMVTSDEVTHGKPHPETFLKAAEALGVDPAKCVGYEDAKLGIQAIHAAGYLAAVDVTLLEGYPHPQE